MSNPQGGAPEAALNERAMPAPGLFVLLMLAALTALGQLATNIVVPSLDRIAADVALEAQAVGLILSSVLVGLALGQIIVGPLSDRIGRRPVLFAGLALYIAAGAGATFSADGTLLLLARMLQGFGASAGLAMPRAIARDRFHGPQFLRVMAILTGAMSVMPGLAPIIGGVMSDAFGWRSSLGLAVVCGILVTLGVAASLPESHHARDGRGGFGSILRDYTRVLANRAFLGHALASAALIGCAYAEVAAAQPVLVRQFGWGAFAVSLVTAAYAACFALAVSLARLIRGAQARRRAGLLFTLAGGLSILIAEAAGISGPWVPIAGALLAQIGNGLLLPLMIGHALMPVGHVAGTAAAALGALHMLVGAAGAGIVAALPLPVMQALPVTMLGFGVLAVLALRWGGEPE